jgi:hypothetical protein
MEYYINRQVGGTVEFKGLKAQYIWWLGIGLALILLVFAILYLFGVVLIILLPMVLIAGVVLFARVYALSRKYGEHGLMKKAAAVKLPKVIKVNRKPL